jgi:hypothetical protein
MRQDTWKVTFTTLTDIRQIGGQMVVVVSPHCTCLSGKGAILVELRYLALTSLYQDKIL